MAGVHKLGAGKVAGVTMTLVLMPVVLEVPELVQSLKWKHLKAHVLRAHGVSSASVGLLIVGSGGSSADTPRG